MTFNMARTILAINFYGTEEGKEINKILNQVDENTWHTGVPTEEGLYVVFNKHLCYDIVEVKPWTTLHGVVAYQKIEPFKENEDGRTD